MADPLRVVIVKPSKYMADGYVERFRWGFMPNSTVPYVRSMTPAGLGGTQVDVHAIDEYAYTDLGYVSLLRRPRGGRTLSLFATYWHFLGLVWVYVLFLIFVF